MLKTLNQDCMNSKQFILTFLVIIATDLSYCQSSSVQWINNSNMDKWNSVSDMIINDNGQIIIAGNFISNDSSTNDNHIFSTNNFFIKKYDQNGKIIWKNEITSNNYCYLTSINIINYDIILAGYFSGELIIEDNIFNCGNKINMFVLTLNNNGNLNFAKHIKGTFLSNNIFIQGIKNDSSFYIAGNYSDSLIIDKKKIFACHAGSIFISSFTKKAKFWI